MGTITAFSRINDPAKRVKVFLDGKHAFTLESGKLLQEKLEVGMELSCEQLQLLLKSLKSSRCLDAAYNYLGYRARSEAELRVRLQRRGFAPDDIEKAVSTLRERGVLDDAAFARSWVEERAAFRPRSRSATGAELRRKGVAPDIVRETLADVDDAETAYSAALPRAKRLSTLDYVDFQRRLGEFLRRRGFTYETITRTVRRVWEERSGDDPGTGGAGQTSFDLDQL